MLADRPLSLSVAVFKAALCVRLNLESIKPQSRGFIRGAHGSQGANRYQKRFLSAVSISISTLKYCKIIQTESTKASVSAG